ncbi:MAG TPA: spore coat U domain-containing protein [Lysobacter sp.]|nr:spore coat U domain-containing protein [Lysobacter sp.]
MKSKIAIAAALLVTSSMAQAATDSTTFTVSTNVTAACDVSASALTFANVDPLANASANTDGTSTVTVTCSNTTAYDVGLSAGNGASATVSSRKMTHTDGSSTLNYALYSNAGRSTNWGDTVGTDTVSGTGTGSAQTHTVYGRIPSGQQTAKVGAYSDTITVTVTY